MVAAGQQEIKKSGVQLAPLDFAKLKLFLTSCTDETQVCATLQALRWRMTRAGSRQRRQVLTSYIHYDILEEAIFKHLHGHSSSRVREYLCSFLNSISSEYQGRTYLLSQSDIVVNLSQMLFSEPNDTYLRQNALGTLQKFSLRKQAQTVMIDCQVIPWILELLGNSMADLSDYTLEYATALLMNLSLRSRGKDSCEQISNVVQVLSTLMEHENLQVRTHVNGTLYSVLTREPLKQQAHAIGLSQILEYLIA